jgi:alanine transaminase
MRPLTLDSLNQQLQTVQYAVRGELAIKAETFRDQLKSGGHNLPFDKVISSNIGNPQQKGLDQPPITFTRQVGNPFLTSYNNLLEFTCHPSGRRPNGMACAR